MKRKALIIYCDNTPSGKLIGPALDNKNYTDYLKSSLGGNWLDNEILSLPNPTIQQVTQTINTQLKGVDYTFIVFTGHGYINLDDNEIQYLEVSNGDIPIMNLITDSKRQTLIIDSCRGRYSKISEKKSMRFDEYLNFKGSINNTRLIFENAVMNADEGLTILFAASKNQTALDTSKGGAYLFSLIEVAQNWGISNQFKSTLFINEAHHLAIKYLNENFPTIQMPTMNGEKRNNSYPLAVKRTKFII
jgi:hypothetical protein